MINFNIKSNSQIYPVDVQVICVKLIDALCTININRYFTPFCSLTKLSFANDNFLIKQQSKIKTAVRS